MLINSLIYFCITFFLWIRWEVCLLLVTDIIISYFLHLSTLFLYFLANFLPPIFIFLFYIKCRTKANKTAVTICCVIASTSRNWKVSAGIVVITSPVGTRIINIYIKLVRFVFLAWKPKKTNRQVALPPGEKLYFWIYHKQVYDKFCSSIFHLPLAYFIR